MKTFTILLILVAIFANNAAGDTEATIRKRSVTDSRVEQASQRILEFKKKEKETEGKILVIGQVARPGFYKVEEPTIEKAIIMAGGTTRLGDATHFYIFSDDQLTEYFAPHARKTPVALEIKGGDVVFIEYGCTAYGASAITEETAEK